MEAAFFDLDKTVIAKASLVAFGRPLYDAGMISRWLVVRAMWSNLMFQRLGADEERMRKFRQSALRVTRGWDQALVSAIVRETLVEVIEPIVYAEALELIAEHKAAGRRVFLISASPEEIVAPLAQFLGVDEAIASRAELDEQGRYTGNVEFWSYGPYKADAIRAAADLYGIDLNESYAYSDSATDMPMMLAVGHPVAVNPDRDLARVARERGWETLWFAHGVPLRERVPMPRPNRALVVLSSTVVITIAGSLAWWWLIGRGRRPTPALLRRFARVPPPPEPSPALAARRFIRLLPVREVEPVIPITPTSRLVRLVRWTLTDRRGDRSAPPIRRPAASSPQQRRGRAGWRSR